MRDAVIRSGLVLLFLPLFALPVAASAETLMAIPDLVAHAEAYDRQMVTVAGRVSDLQLATNRDGQPAYGFLLKESDKTLKVIGLGRPEVRDGDPVIVEGVFSRHRQVGRNIIYNEIKATVVRPMDRTNPDLVG
jgi:hypothetical protein